MHEPITVRILWITISLTATVSNDTVQNVTIIYKNNSPGHIGKSILLSNNAIYINTYSNEFWSGFFNLVNMDKFLYQTKIIKRYTFTYKHRGNQ